MSISSVEFTSNKEILEIVNDYKYFGVYMNEFLDYNKCVDTLCDSGGRALGCIINKMRDIKDLGYQTFTKLYENYVASIVDYGCEVWGVNDFRKCDVIHNRAIRFYLGVHRYAPTLAFKADIGWMNPKDRRTIKILRFWNHLLNLNNERLPKNYLSWN